MANSKKETEDLEKMISKLETIVKKLEGDKNLSLEESIKQFEEGVSLYKKSKEILNLAEKKVKILTESLKEEDLTLED